MIEVLLVAPYTAVRAGLGVLLSESGEITVVGEARDEATAEYLVRTLRPNAVLVDGSPALLSEVLAVVSEVDISVVALCEDLDDVVMLARRRAAAWCALQRSAGGAEIIAGLSAASAGIVALDPSFAAALIAAGADPPPPAPLAVDPGLTPREREVLQLMTQGLPNKNIASRLHISLSTAKFHVASILTKLEASSRTEAVTIGARMGLVSL